MVERDLSPLIIIVTVLFGLIGCSREPTWQIVTDGGLVFEEHLKDRLTCETVLQSDRYRAVNRSMTSIGKPLSCREEKSN